MQSHLIERHVEHRCGDFPYVLREMLVTAQRTETATCAVSRLRHVLQEMRAEACTYGNICSWVLASADSTACPVVEAADRRLDDVRW